MRAIERHEYPGNVRELAHLVERACLLARGPELGVELLPAELRGAAADPGDSISEFQRLDNDELQLARERAAAAVERRFLDALMQRHGGNVSQAARESGIHRSYLQKLLAKHRAGAGAA